MEFSYDAACWGSGIVTEVDWVTALMWFNLWPRNSIHHAPKIITHTLPKNKHLLITRIIALFLEDKKKQKTKLYVERSLHVAEDYRNLTTSIVVPI